MCAYYFIVVKISALFPACALEKYKKNRLISQNTHQKPVDDCAISRYYFRLTKKNMFIFFWPSYL